MLWTTLPEPISVRRWPDFDLSRRLPAPVCGVSFMTHAQRRRRVLIVEDEPALRLSYERAFHPRYDLLFASTGAEALELLEQQKPDVAVLDMRLPDTDGVELLRRIRLIEPKLPVIITTAYMSIEPQLKVLDLPHSGYIVKPFRLDELGARIDAVL
jgi:two-component system, OmpR family, response regulator